MALRTQLTSETGPPLGCQLAYSRAGLGSFSQWADVQAADRGQTDRGMLYLPYNTILLFPHM